jgi:four helix bundle protein
MSISRFRELKAWQLGLDLTEQIYLLSDSFPKSEIYGLTSQMRRSAVSIPSNIAEGNGRDSTKEFLHFIAIAVGSICELETQLLLSHRLNYMKEEELNTVISLLIETKRTTRGLQKSLKDKIGGS